ncbi:MAG: UvrB/UvrC motif-containing protein, partial [Thermodesulfovibrionales bacterium]|nr:UvrB/UvrC motif-containing protein [Thermodesulfovibrionales bacterium]
EIVKFRYLAKDKISRLPKNSGVYAFKKGAELLYIGKAANIQERVKNHFQQPGYKDYLFLNKVKKVGYIKTGSEIEALILEANLIKKYQPKYNVIWKDDKNYFFVGITKEDFPRIFWTHQKKIKNQKLKIKNEYVGPFVDGKALKETLKILRKVFPYRSCASLPKRACLWYHLGRCPAPCLLKSKILEVPEIQKKIKNEIQRNANSLFEIIKGKKTQVLKELKREMKKVSEKQNFEEAAKIRDQIE